MGGIETTANTFIRGKRESRQESGVQNTVGQRELMFNYKTPGRAGGPEEGVELPHPNGSTWGGKVKDEVEKKRSGFWGYFGVKWCPGYWSQPTLRGEHRTCNNETKVRYTRLGGGWVDGRTVPSGSKITETP